MLLLLHSHLTGVGVGPRGMSQVQVWTFGLLFLISLLAEVRNVFNVNFNGIVCKQVNVQK